MKLTRQRQKALRWFRDEHKFNGGEPIGMFNRTAPSRRMRDALAADGLLVRYMPPYGLITYALSDAGRSALANPEGE